MRILASLVLASAVTTGGCNAQEPIGSSPSASSAPARAGGHVVIQHAEAGAAEGAVRSALAAATASKRRLVVYVGAPWCEPCQRFHQAAARGELDGTFPDLTLVEFDADADGERLAAAGYVSRYIPLFALPAGDGRASGKQIEGGIKGDGAVANIVPRLRELLAR
jgi:hypothetical protein